MTSTSLNAAAAESASISARDARIRAPLSAVTASLVAAGLPASLAVNPEAASAATDYSAFELACRQYFPASLPNGKVAERVIRTLRARGYQPDNTLLASSLCSDEINDTDLSLFAGLQDGLTKANSGGVFNLGGLGGVPFVGPSGFGAFFSHSPKDGHIVIVYGPHVGISADGVVGKVERVGMEKPSGACGAALGAYKAIKAEREKQMVTGLAGTQLEGFPYETTQPDVQEDFIIRDLRARMEREELDGPDQNALIAMVSNKMYDMVSDLLLREVDGAIKKPGFWQGITEVTLLGGIVINRGNPDGKNRVEDYFKPITFQSLKKAEGGNTVVTDNLLAYLYDEDTMLGSLSEMSVSGDALVGAGVAAGVLAGVSAIGSLFKNDGGGRGGGGGSRSRRGDKEIVFQ